MVAGRKAWFAVPRGFTTRGFTSTVNVVSRGPIPLIGGWGATNSCVTISRWTPIERT
jgi:hypothetical protein